MSKWYESNNVQLHVGTQTPTIRPIRNHSRVKPSGGLWTSTYFGPTHGSDWVQWCLRNDFMLRNIGHSYLVYPSNGVKLYDINTIDDINYLFENYSYIDRLVSGNNDVDEGVYNYLFRYIDFEKLQSIYDGVHLTRQGMINTRTCSPYNTYTWDCESTIWFRNVFDKIEDLGKVKYKIEGDIDG